MGDLLRLASPVSGDTAHDDGLEHVVCCRDDDTALCGTRVANTPWENGDPPCVVCDDLEPVGCDVCPVKRGA